MRAGLLLLAFVVIAVVAINIDRKPPPVEAPPPTGAPDLKRLEALESDLAGWGEGRWQDWQWRWDAETNKLVVSIATDPQANEVAVAGYCLVLKDLAQEHARGYPFEGIIKRSGRVVRVCR